MWDHKEGTKSNHPKVFQCDFLTSKYLEPLWHLAELIIMNNNIMLNCLKEVLLQFGSKLGPYIHYIWYVSGFFSSLSTPLLF